MIAYHNAEELEKMRKAGRILGEILWELKRAVRPGINLLELDAMGEELMIKRGTRPAFKGYRGYRHATCLSLNEEVVHGIPTDRVLKQGDILGIDIGLALDGYHSDTAATVAVGDVPKKVRKLLKMTEEALETGIRQARDGNHVGDIGQAVEQVALKGGFGIVRDLFGHGVGTSLHMDPLIPNFGKAGQGVPLKTGMAIAIEPMFNLGGDAVETLPDGWTVVTKDGSLSAHFEHTLVITEKGPEVLTEVEKR